MGIRTWPVTNFLEGMKGNGHAEYPVQGGDGDLPCERTSQGQGRTGCGEEGEEGRHRGLERHRRGLASA